MSGTDITPRTSVEIVPASTQGLDMGVPWRRVVAAYLDAAVDSDNTRRAYRRHLAAAFEWLDAYAVSDITGAQLAAYRAHVVGLDISPASQGQALAALRSFLKWAGAMGAHQLPGDMIRAALRTPSSKVQRPYQVVTDREIVRMLEATTNTRDCAILGLMLGAGLRVAEVVALDVDDLVEDGDGELLVHVRQGKGRKDRSVPLRADVAECVRAYIHESGRRFGDQGALFRSRDRAGKGTGRLTTRGVGYIVATVADRAGISAKRVSPHALRHTMAIRTYRGGHDIVALQKILGHASISTTQRYADHLELGELRNAMPSLPTTEAQQ